MNPIKTPISSSYQVIAIVGVFLLVWLSCFWQPLSAQSYTLWDTHDSAFTNFLFFSDALHSGTFALWNPFIQGGTFFPNFVNVGLFTPFQLFFVGLSWLINPVYAFELWIQFILLVGVFGAYCFFRLQTENRWLAFLGAISFCPFIVWPMVGQLAILVSLSSLPCLLLLSQRLAQGSLNGFLQAIFLGTLAALYLASGYVWMNFINVSIAASYALYLLVFSRHAKELKDAYPVIRRIGYLGVFFLTLTAIYCALILPGFWDMQFNFELLSRNYQSPDPRMRSININQDFFGYGSIFKALVTAIDPRVYLNDPSWRLGVWAYGAGWVMWISLLALPQSKNWRESIFWWALLATGLLYSAGDANLISEMASKIPILNANRWRTLGTFYVGFALVCLVVNQLTSFANSSQVNTHSLNRSSSPSVLGYFIRLGLTGLLSLGLLAYFSAPWYEWVLVLLVLLVLGAFTYKSKVLPLYGLVLVLLSLNAAAFLTLPISGYSYFQTGKPDYFESVAKRKIDTTISTNARELGGTNHYNYTDERWLLDKIPSTHGYNNLGNPYFWYVKNDPFLERLVVLTQTVRPEQKVDPKPFVFDHDYAKARMADALSEMAIPTINSAAWQKIIVDPLFMGRIIDLQITPNKAVIQVENSAPTYLIFNNVNRPGWRARLNGQATEMVSANHIFQGVYLKEAGMQTVVFEFFPRRVIALLLLPYGVLLLCFFGLMWHHLKKRPQRR